MKPCPHCNGTGEPSDPSKAMCSPCGGSGDASMIDGQIDWRAGLAGVAREMALAEEMRGRDLAKAKLEAVPSPRRRAS